MILLVAFVILGFKIKFLFLFGCGTCKNDDDEYFIHVFLSIPISLFAYDFITGGYS